MNIFNKIQEFLTVKFICEVCKKQFTTDHYSTYFGFRDGKLRWFTGTAIGETRCCGKYPKMTENKALGLVNIEKCKTKLSLKKRQEHMNRVNVEISKIWRYDY